MWKDKNDADINVYDLLSNTRQHMYDEVSVLGKRIKKWAPRVRVNARFMLVPQQDNSYDCGMLVCMNARDLCSRSNGNESTVTVTGAFVQDHATVCTSL